jgi:hypothetical protein
MDTTILQQGRFTSTGVAKLLAIRSDVDWIKVINLTTTTAVGGGTGVEFFWMRGMPQDTAIEYTKTAVTNALATGVVATGGITLTDTTIAQASAPVAFTAISNALPGVVASAVPWGFTLNNGDIVRLSSVVGGRQLQAIDFQVGGVVPNTSFTLVNMPAIIAVAAPGANARWRKISYDAYWYPRNRYIASISQAVIATVTTTVDHGYTAGQEVRITVPAEYGMQEINNLQVVVLTVPTPATFTINVDTTGFAAFAFPLTAQAPFSPAMVTPIGEAAVVPFESLMDDATINTGVLGVTLAAGVNSPAGVNTNVIYWLAGKSFSVDNQ